MDVKMQSTRGPLARPPQIANHGARVWQIPRLFPNLVNHAGGKVRKRDGREGMKKTKAHKAGAAAVFKGGFACEPDRARADCLCDRLCPPHTALRIEIFRNRVKIHQTFLLLEESDPYIQSIAHQPKKLDRNAVGESSARQDIRPAGSKHRKRLTNNGATLRTETGLYAGLLYNEIKFYAFRIVNIYTERKLS
jgi:hypothetical protein